MFSHSRRVQKLYTFGYEGLSIEDFISRLREEGTRLVIDVRQHPLSRKRGFSKRSLAEALALSKLEYVHMRSLGCPKPIRERYKADGNWAAYTSAFNMHLKTQTESLLELVKAARSKTSCLICFEADFKLCHRSLVATAASHHASDILPIHLSSTAPRIMSPELPLEGAAWADR